MKQSRMKIFAIILAVALLPWLALPAATAAGCTSVIVNSVELSAQWPYWKNGDTVHSQLLADGEWNAYFDAATSTLTLYNAVIDTVPILESHMYLGMIYAYGDLNIVLTGDSTMAYDNDTYYGTLFGVHIIGSVTFSGAGSLDINLVNLFHQQEYYGSVYVSTVIGSISILSGQLSIFAQGARDSFGLLLEDTLLIAGGDTTIKTVGATSRALGFAGSSFRMTGGRLTAVAEATGAYAYALETDSISLDGGEGRFTARNTGEGTAYGAVFTGDPFSFSNGHFIFSGQDTALRYTGIGSAGFVLNDGKVYVSQLADGSGADRWYTNADGILASTASDPSPFRYVEFLLYTPSPQTGDTQTPWLWIGLAAAAVAGIAVLIIVLRKKPSGK
ncbi:MAG TPA: LPXTG cell wall anchor domain-containing protein [Candidatus Limiplasma sp.]|nr:LPXTG cell wall anchor domain-containing protein [Candidatus Limiplasma sp.]